MQIRPVSTGDRDSTYRRLYDNPLEKTWRIKRMCTRRYKLVALAGKGQRSPWWHNPKYVYRGSYEHNRQTNAVSTLKMSYFY